MTLSLNLSSRGDVEIVGSLFGRPYSAPGATRRGAAPLERGQD